MLTVIGISTSAHAQSDEIKLTSPEWLFGQRAAIQDISLSPDGKQVVFIAPGPGRDSRVYHASLDDKKPKMITVSSGNPERATWCDFVSNTRIACRLYYVHDEGGLLLSSGELIALDIDGQDLKPLGQKRSLYSTGRRQFDGYIVDWLPESNDVLMAWNFVPEVNAGSKINRTAEGLGVVKLNSKTGRWKGVEKARRFASDYISDGNGNIRIVGSSSVRATGDSGTTIRYSYRLPDSKKLLPLSNYDFSARKGFRPLAIEEAKNIAYGLQLHQGRMALYSMTLDGNLKQTLLYSHPTVDVAGVKRFGHDGRVVGV
ncbi:MAG: hypothetical protein AAGM33_07385, partial [Pseudomonadota bacterium]